jgi:hypothetical protein
MLRKPLLVGTSTDRPVVWVLGTEDILVQRRMEAAFPHALAIHCEGTKHPGALNPFNISATVKALGYTDVVLCHPGLSFETQLACLAPLHQQGVEVHLMQRMDGALIGSEGASAKGHVFEGNPALAQPVVQREKRRFDHLFAWLVVLGWPVVLLSAAGPWLRLQWAFKVLQGQATWVGYPPGIDLNQLPVLKPAFASCWMGQDGLENTDLMQRSAQLYAAGYTTGGDLKILMQGWRKDPRKDGN